MPANIPKGSKISHAQVIQLNAFMETVIDRTPEGIVTYKGDWTDQKLADRFGVLRSSVSNLRVELHGKLRPAPGSAAASDARLEAALQKMEQQANALDELRVKYHKLVTYLHLNQRADVKHLKLDAMDERVFPGHNGHHSVARAG